MLKSLKNRGVVSDIPVYEEGVAGAPGGAPPATRAASPRQGGGGGAKKETPYLHRLARSGKGLSEDKSIISAALNAQEMGQIGGFQDVKGQAYYPIIHGKESPEKVLAAVARESGLQPAEVLAQYKDGMGGFTNQALANDRLVSSHYMGMMGAAERAARGVGRDLLAEDIALQASARGALGIEEAALQSRYGGTRVVAAQMPADAGMPEWLPRMNNLPPVQTGMAYGLAAAGVGAGAAIALANHLAAKGQQQSDPVQYAAAMQALNAYA